MSKICLNCHEDINTCLCDCCTPSTCTSFLAGKHSENIEINTSLPYVALYDYFFQGDEADKVINNINYIYNTQNCTVLEACEIYASKL